MKISNKGISLIVLVITIIILSILAAVAIITLKNTGIIKDAEDAVEDFELPQVQELASFAWSEARIKGLKTSKEIKEYVIAEVKKEFSEDILAKYDIEVTKKKVVVSLAGQGGSGDDVAGGGTTPEPDLPENSLVAMYKAGTLKQGDYVDYIPSPGDSWTLTSNVDGAYTCIIPNGSDIIENQASAISQEDLNWRVLGYDEENDELLLISGSPTIIGTVCVERNSLGYNNYINALDSTCRALYSNTTLGALARSVNSNDLDVYLGGDAYDKTTYGNEVDSNGNVIQIKSGGYGYVNSKIAIKSYIDETTGNIMTSNTERNFDKPSTIYNLDFANLTSDETILDILGGKNRNYFYWLASRRIEVTSSTISACVTYFSDTSINNENLKNLYIPSWGVGGIALGVTPLIRPVVALPSSVTVDDVSIIDVAPQETWEYPYTDMDGALDE